MSAPLLETAALDFVRHLITEVGHAPTIPEIANALRVPRSTARTLVVGLQRVGKLTRTEARERNIGLGVQPDLTTVGSSAMRAELARRGETLEALVPRDMLAFGTRRSCAADTCGAAVSVGHLFCRSHWWRLPRDLQDAIKDAHGRRDVDRYQALVAEARDVADGGARWNERRRA